MGGSTMSPDKVNQRSESGWVYASLCIGRDPAHNQVVIQHPDMSRRHAVIERRQDGIYLTDLNSTHGTYVEGAPVKGSVRLSPPQWIQFKSGNYLFDGIRLMNQQMETVGVLADNGFHQAQPLALGPVLLAPFKKNGWLKWLLGSLMLFIPIVEVFTLGYRYRLFRQGMENQWSLPQWTGWRELFFKGLQMLVIRIVYMLLPAAVTLLFFAGTYMKDISTGLLYTMLLTTAFTFLVAAFLIPMAMASFAATGTMSAAFSLPDVLKSIGTAGKEYVMVFFLISGLWLVNLLLVMIPYAGYALGILTFFYVNMVAALLYGAVHRNIKRAASG